jgi:hypothetical protein
MSIAFSFLPPSSHSLSSQSPSTPKSIPSFSFSPSSLRLRLTPSPSPSFRINHRTDPLFILHSTDSTGGSFGGHDDGGSFGGHGHGGNGKDNDGHGDGGESNDGHGDGHGGVNEVLLLLAQAGRSLESLPADLASAIKDGKIPASVVARFLELEKSPFMRWLLQFAGFKERLLADDLFLAKVGMECGVGVFTKVFFSFFIFIFNFIYCLASNFYLLIFFHLVFYAYLLDCN